MAHIIHVGKTCLMTSTSGNPGTKNVRVGRKNAAGRNRAVVVSKTIAIPLSMEFCFILRKPLIVVPW